VNDEDNRLLPVWQSVVADLEPTLSQQQRAWLSLTRPVGLLGSTALLAAPSDFAKEAIERSLREGITTTLSHHLGQPINLAVTVSDDAEAAATTAIRGAAPARRTGTRRCPTGRRAPTMHGEPDSATGPTAPPTWLPATSPPTTRPGTTVTRTSRHTTPSRR